MKGREFSIIDKTDLDVSITAAYGICFNEERRVLLGKNPTTNNWLVPGGRVEGTENPQQTLIRELDEEVSVSISNIALLAIQKTKNLETNEETYQHIYVCKIEKISTLTEDPAKNLMWERKFVDLNHAIKCMEWNKDKELIKKRIKLSFMLNFLC